MARLLVSADQELVARILITRITLLACGCNSPWAFLFFQRVDEVFWKVDHQIFAEEVVMQNEREFVWH